MSAAPSGHVRAATATDLDAVVDVFVSCWRVSYAGLLPPATLDAIDEPAARVLWGALLAPDGAEVADGGGGADVVDTADVVLVLECDGVVGAVARCSGLGRSDGRVESLYVAPRLQGRGAGGRMLTACTDLLGSRGARTASLWVFEQNLPARAFYAARGWRPTGEQRVEEAWGAPELELRRDLSGSGQADE